VSSQEAELLTVLTLVAEIIGFIFLGFAALLGLVTIGSVIHEFIRVRSLKYDRYWYD
jgi:hypothetical protein